MAVHVFKKCLNFFIAELDNSKNLTPGFFETLIRDHTFEFQYGWFNVAVRVFKKSSIVSEFNLVCGKQLKNL